MRKLLILTFLILIYIPAFASQKQKTAPFDNIAKEQYNKIYSQNPLDEIPTEFDWKKTPPQDLTDVFTQVLKESLAIEKNYYVKMTFYSMPVNKQCNSFAYFTARSVFTKEISLNTRDYVLKDIYIVVASGEENLQNARTSFGYVTGPSADLKTDRGSTFFIDANGNRHIPWDHHAIALFVMQSLKDGNIYYMVPDPFLYNRGVGLAEWVGRYHPAMTNFKVSRFALNPDLDKKRIPESQTMAAKTKEFIKQLSDMKPYDPTIKR